MAQENTSNPGKVMSMGGLIMGIISLLGGIGILFIAMGWASFGGAGGAYGLAIGWTCFAVVGLLLSVMGRNKSKTAGSKTGLGTFAMIVGIMAVLSCGGIFSGIHMAQGAVEIGKTMDSSAVKSMTGMQDDAQHMVDSINKANGVSDSAK